VSVITPQRQAAQAVNAPAPTAGIVASALYAESDLGMAAAIYAYNVVPAEYGCYVRSGTREHAINLQNILDEPGEVRSLLYYHAATQITGSDEMFAVTDKGIYDITVPSTAPVLVHTWTATGGNAGWCSSVNFTNVNGDHFLLVCDERNGYHIYDGTAWALGAVTGTSVPTVDELAHITEWQGRIWFTRRNSTQAWYLAPLALGGDITLLDSGNRFKQGGYLVQNTTWTLDNGAGMDDYLVQVSSAGDVLVWSGTDPDNPTAFSLLGRWFLGEVPKGRRIVSDWGGDLVLLTRAGLVKLSGIVGGESTLTDQSAITYNISRLIRNELSKSFNQFGWGLERHPEQEVALVTVPQTASELTRAPIQFVMYLETGAWCIYRDLDIMSSVNTPDGVFVGVRDGRALQFTGHADDLNLSGDSAKDIEFSFLTHFTDLQAPASWKKPVFIRPSWLGSAQPQYNMKVVFDFNFTDLTTTQPASGRVGGVWDAGLWDAAVWGITAQTVIETHGVSGMGRHVAIAVKGRSNSELSYLGSALMLEMGGML